LALLDDLPAIEALVERALDELLDEFLSQDEVAASRHIMGVDRQLVADGTYFLAFSGDTLAACGGWSHRATLFGGDATLGRNSRQLDPGVEPARIRAMYTHPDWTRRGLGRLILSACENAAREAGFSQAELAATRAGWPLYAACGYIALEDWQESTPNGVGVPLTRMRKTLD
tara:strand:+ start:31997 stop:32512 length:516 start_codon:yes stop_codon:yes gene_type:complete